MLASLAVAAALAMPSADCSAKSVPVNVKGGDLLEAEFFGGGGPLGPRTLTKGEPLAGKRLKGGQVYYAPGDVTAVTRIGRYTYGVDEKSVFLAQCKLFGKGMYFRLLEGKVRVHGPSFSGNRSKGYTVTPEATFKPRPGQPSYTLERTVTDSQKTTHSDVHVNKGGSTMFVTLSGASGRKVPCQAGDDLTIFADGRTG